MNFVKRQACHIVRTSIARQLPAPMTNYLELLSHSKSTKNNKLSIVLQLIYNSLTRDIGMQENENLFLKRLRNFKFQNILPSYASLIKILISA